MACCVAFVKYLSQGIGCRGAPANRGCYDWHPWHVMGGVVDVAVGVPTVMVLWWQEEGVCELPKACRTRRIANL